MRIRMRRSRDGINHYDRIPNDQVGAGRDYDRVLDDPAGGDCSGGRGGCAGRNRTGERDYDFHHHAIQQRHGREEDHDAIQLVVSDLFHDRDRSTGRDSPACADDYDPDHDDCDLAVGA